MTFLLTALTAISVNSAPIRQIGSPDCETARQQMEAPYYYCDCFENSNTFSFPLEAEITDTVWYIASVDDLKKGISAYWFSDCSVTMEVYAMCTSKAPTISLTIGKNQMRDVDVAKINEKLNEMGQTAQEILGVLKPRIRVYPNGGTGRVYCYPYDEGPVSSCNDPLPLRPVMTYVSSNPTSEYKLDYTLIASTGKTFIHWKQKNSKPCEIWLTLDSCNGEEIGRATLSDSLHIFQPDSTIMKNAQTGKHNIWLHAKHANNISGRLYFYNNPKSPQQTKPEVNKKTCQGKSINVNMRTYKTDTTFVDTLWVKKDTLTTQKVTLTFTEPALEFDTVYVSPSQLKNGYRYTPSGDILYTYSDTIVDIVKTSTCTRRIQVTVLEPTGTENIFEKSGRIYKQILDGQLFIIVDDRKYTILGQPAN